MVTRGKTKKSTEASSSPSSESPASAPSSAGVTSLRLRKSAPACGPFASSIRQRRWVSASAQVAVTA